MNHSFAYVSAPVFEGRSTKELREYCRELYELGYLPICPNIMFSQFLADDIPEEREESKAMSLELLRRCRVVVVCTNDITENMEKEILLAKKLGITATTLAGIRRIAAHTKKGEDA